MIDRLKKRQAAGLARPRQIRVLENFGFQHVGTWTFDAANNMINRMVACGDRGRWRVPPGVDPATYDGK